MLDENTSFRLKCIFAHSPHSCRFVASRIVLNLLVILPRLTIWSLRSHHQEELLSSFWGRIFQNLRVCTARVEVTSLSVSRSIRPQQPLLGSRYTLPCMNNSANNSNNPFQKGDPFKTKNYNKLLLRFSAAVIVILFVAWLLIAFHIIHF